MLAAWLHDLSPFLVQFPDGWPLGGLRWYGLSYLAGFTVGWLVVRRMIARGKLPLAKTLAVDLTVAVAMGLIIGGRLGYVLFYEPALLGVIDGFPFWGVLAINRGGMASHGGILGALVAIFLFTRKHRLRFLPVLDVCAPGACPGLLFGRIANFINGELYGRPADPAFPLAVKFPHELFDRPPQEVEQIAIDYLLTTDAQSPGGGFNAYAVIDQLIQAVQQGDAQARAFIEPLLTARHPSQLYAGALEGVAVFLVLLFVWRKPRKPGTIAASFGIAYALARIANEFWRLPDAQFIADDGTLPLITRGQWLSALLLFIAVAMLIAVQRRNTAPASSATPQANLDHPEPNTP